MIITYHGLEAFKAQFGDTVLAFNPVSKDSSGKVTRFGADVALVSLWDKDFNGVENVTFGEKIPFVISQPGEYDVKGVFIQGFPSKSSYGGKERINTIYSVMFEDMHLCFLGAIKDAQIANETLEALEAVDILFVPIGGNGTLDAAQAYRLAVSLEPKIIIPMHDTSDGKALKTFLKEGGEESQSPIDKLTIKRKDIEGKKGEVFILSPQ
ncbi:MAG: MBL fold metallo-hydrolase [Patescibacteria group bacterium]|nr:MBL fold metallo-hydrolase [bacterium]MDZ4240524.1 MBL fold metallo-hydrolase [Patescibacteria group bacterium]